MGEWHVWCLSGDLASCDQMKEERLDAYVCEFTSFSVPEGAAQCGDVFLILRNSTYSYDTSPSSYSLLFFSFFFNVICDFHPFKNSPRRSQPLEFQGFFK